jgi:hypothetical protein
VWDPIVLPNPDAGVCEKVWTGTRFAVSIPSLIAWLGRHGDAQTLPIIENAITAINQLGTN